MRKLVNHHEEWNVRLTREEGDSWPVLKKEHGIGPGRKIEPHTVYLRFTGLNGKLRHWPEKAVVDGYQLNAGPEYPDGKMSVWGEEFWVNLSPWLQKLVREAEGDLGE